MIYRTAYDTTACSGFMMKKTVDAIRVAAAHGTLRPIPNTDVRVIEGGAAVIADIPAFAHPLSFNDGFKDQLIAVDVRGYGSWNTHQAEFMVRNVTECNLALLRAKLNQIWLKERPQTLRDLSHAPMAIFAAWISENVGRRFALDPREQFELAILAGVFYASLFMEESKLEERDKMRITNAVARAVKAKAEDVLDVFDILEASGKEMLAGVGEFCAAAVEVTKSVRLQELNPGVLFAILGSTWYGTNAKEMVAVALEHPPTWLAILMAVYTERTFKHSGITKVAERIAGRNGGDDFMRSVANVIRVAVDA